MTPTLEFATAVLDTMSFVLVTPDLFGKERVSSAGARFERAAAYLLKLSVRILIRLLNPKLAAAAIFSLFVACLAGWTDSWDRLPTVAHPLLKAVWMFPTLFVLAETALLGCMYLGLGILRVLERYNFNGVLLAIGAMIFLTSRTLIMIETWPH